jgi:hypothetical protein
MRNKATDPAFARLRALVLADCDLLNELAGLTDEEPFVTRLVELAASHGIATSEHAIRLTIRPDPLGLSRFAPVEPTQSRWPPPGFLPVMAGGQGSGFVIDWAWFGPEPLTEPFFEGAIRAALRRPFNRAFRWRMSLTDFLAGAAQPATKALKPDGFIFHMSRCGSTLVSQMLAQSDCNIAISEASPIDAAVQTNSPEILRAMVEAFGRPRSGHEQRFFIKLDSWHALALPLFDRAFPETPWVFLFRDPVEVLVSQQREPGAQMVPTLVAPSIYGIDGTNIPGPDYTARVLNRICTAAAGALGSRRGLAINYRNLPQAFEARILPHFGTAPGGTEMEAMRAARRADAKTPSMPFSADSAAKQAAASDNLRALAQRHLTDIIDDLDAIATAQAKGQAATLL